MSNAIKLPESDLQAAFWGTIYAVIATFFGTGVFSVLITLWLTHLSGAVSADDILGGLAVVIGFWLGCIMVVSPLAILVGATLGSLIRTRLIGACQTAAFTLGVVGGEVTGVTTMVLWLGLLRCSSSVAKCSPGLAGVIGNLWKQDQPLIVAIIAISGVGGYWVARKSLERRGET